MSQVVSYLPSKRQIDVGFVDEEVENESGTVFWLESQTYGSTSYAEENVALHRTPYPFLLFSIFRCKSCTNRYAARILVTDLLYSPQPDGDTNRIHTPSVALSFPY